MLRNDIHLSLEQGLKVTEYFQMQKEEREMLLNILQREKAGTEELRKYFSQRIEEIKSNRARIDSRLGKFQGLSPEAQIKYYSKWIYSAVHISCLLNIDDQVEFIIERFKLSHKSHFYLK